MRESPIRYSERLLKLIEQDSGYTRHELLAPRGEATLYAWRCICYAVMRGAGFSFPEIARAFARDHKTVMYAFSKADPEAVGKYLDLMLQESESSSTSRPLTPPRPSL